MSVTMTRGAQALGCEQLADQSLGGLGITAALHKDFQYETILIDGTPEPVLLAADRNDGLVEVPYVDGPLLARTL